ncbi:MAG: hypothetical protein ACFFA3_18370 [Promethearchaeota archaeon]
MGKDTPFVMEGDDEFDVELTIYKLIGYKYPDYKDDAPESLPPRELLEKHLLDPSSKLRKLLDDCKIGYLEFLILGGLILKTGATLPEKLKEKILKTAQWKIEKDRWKYTDNEFKKLRKDFLEDFREKIENHRVGVKTDVL